MLIAFFELLTKCAARLQRLLNYIPEFQRKRMYKRNFAEDWVDESGRLLIMGEAAYPIWVSN